MALKKKIKKILGLKTSSEYQERRMPDVKFEMMYKALENVSECKTLLDIGCNAGKVTEAFANKGLFAVGIDHNPRIIDYPENKRPIIGYFPFNPESAGLVPNFDIILLLSVHHQWVKKYNDEYAQKLIATLIQKAQHYMFIEFATINSKYGYKEPRFDDHDENSQKKYYEEWLKGVEKFYGSEKPGFTFSYVGKNKELAGVEEYRQTYLIKKLR